MSLQTIEINGIKVTFDKEKTLSYQQEKLSACACEECRNFYKTIETNTELSGFLAQFGVDCNLTDEVFWYEMGEGDSFYYDSDGYYGVCGSFDGNEFSFEKSGVTISFLKTACLPVDREDEHFYIRIKGAFPLVLNEDERDVENKKLSDRIISLFKKNK